MLPLDIETPCRSFLPELPIEAGAGETRVGFAGKKVCFDYPVHISIMLFFGFPSS
jgi:hypothetical protein